MIDLNFLQLCGDPPQLNIHHTRIGSRAAKIRRGVYLRDFAAGLLSDEQQER
jgi:hypothetical protein